MNTTSQDHPHRRYNQLTGEWVLVSPHRAKRPWQGKTEQVVSEIRPKYDPNCYLCPGNERIGGEINEQYKSTYVFTNDFAALLSEQHQAPKEDSHLFQTEAIRGLCKVICFSPDHSLTLPVMEIEQIQAVVHLWQKEYTELAKLDYINYVQIFENKGELMGCSNPHPHGQIWATSTLPDELAKEQQNQEVYFTKYGRTLLSAYLEEELAAQERLVLENDHFVVLVPFWAIWPYETIIISKRGFSHIGQMTAVEMTAYADILKKLTIRYDNLYNTSFPYSAGIHQAPTDGLSHPEWHFHMHFYPPLLRSATVKKFMVGYELLANAQRDITAEHAAKILRELPDHHYLK